jgi:hypothetical protein
VRQCRTRARNSLARLWSPSRSPRSLHLSPIRSLDTSQTYLYFFDAPCLFYTICLVFRYTLWRFYAISGTNLLTRCHSASSLFSAIFVFQKCYTGNILGIRRNKFQNSYFIRTKDEDRKRAGGGQGPASHQGGAAQPLVAPPMCEEPLAAP